MKDKNLIGQAQLERKVKAIRKQVPELQIRGGWIKYIRSILGIKLTTLAKLADTTPSLIQQAEKKEVEGVVTMKTLRRMAEAMDCELVYAFVPKKNVKSLIQDRAMSKARKILERADLHMTLEDQKVINDYETRIKRLADNLIDSNDIW